MQGVGLANTSLAPAPSAAHLDRLPVASPQEALVISFDSKGHEGPRGDVSPVPSHSHTFPMLVN